MMGSVLSLFWRPSVPDGYEPVSPWDATQTRFRAESGLGQGHPALFQGSLTDAMRQAAETSKLLVIYLHCPHHQDTDIFVRQTLTAMEIIRCLDSDFVFWMEYFLKPEAHALSGVLSVESFPFLAVVYPDGQRQSSLTIHAKIDGFIGPVQLLTKLHTVKNIFNYSFVSQRAQQNQHAEVRSLRNEQDLEYMEALERDRLRLEQLQREADDERERKQIELEKEQSKDQEIERRNVLFRNLPVEPDSDQPGVIAIQIRMKDGKKLQRRFKDCDLVQDVYSFVLGSDTKLNLSNFILVSSFPRVVYNNQSLTLISANIPSQCLLFIDESGHFK
uniref:UBX domain-containing protein n=1 Tax=Spongospora subterranea TaxID=70186 RepID=A0A0H5QMW0_9EUKA|eukprot:CRZ02897.1 hypothetical protein [Spongospora subterranea]